MSIMEKINSNRNRYMKTLPVIPFNFHSIAKFSVSREQPGTKSSSKSINLQEDN
jgi:hypothetical protein